jgi:HD-like signal output (HDOD) protein
LKLKCPHCSKIYNIPESRLPDNPDLKFKCKSCNGIISVKRDILLEFEDSCDTGDKTEKKEEFLNKARALPPIPKILFKAREIINDESRDIRDLAEVLEKDQAMTTRVLKIANSVYYSLKSPVNSVQQACVILGADTLLQMITLASTSKLLSKELNGYSVSSGEVFSHSTGVAFAARFIAFETFPELATDAFSAGILHDAGKLVLDEHLVKNKEFFVAKVSEGVPVHSVEKEIFGFDHAEIGHDFLKKWNIPNVQCEAIKWHHEPSKSKGNRLAHILHAANALVLLLEEMTVDDNIQIEPGTLDFLKLDSGKLEKIRSEANQAAEEVFHGFIN